MAKVKQRQKLSFNGIVDFSLKAALLLAVLCAGYAFSQNICLYWFPDFYINTLENGYKVDFPRFTYLLFQIPSMLLYFFGDQERYRELSLQILNALNTFHPYLGLLFCFWILKKNKNQKLIIFPILSFALAYQFSAALTAHGGLQSHTFFWVTFCLVFVKIYPSNNNAFHSVWLYLAYILFVFCYLPATILGSLFLLSVIFYAHASKVKEQGPVEYGVLFSVLLSGLVLASILLIELPHFKAVPYHEFLIVLTDINSFLRAPYLYVVLSVTIFSLLFHFLNKYQFNRKLYILMIVVIVGFNLLYFYESIPFYRINLPFTHFAFRIYIAPVSIFFAVLMMICHRHFSHMSSQVLYFLFLKMICILILIYSSIGYRDLAKSFALDMKKIDTIMKHRSIGCMLIEDYSAFKIIKSQVIDYSFFLNEGLIKKKLVVIRHDIENDPNVKAECDQIAQ